MKVSSIDIFVLVLIYIAIFWIAAFLGFNSDAFVEIMFSPFTLVILISIYFNEMNFFYPIFIICSLLAFYFSIYAINARYWTLKESK